MLKISSGQWFDLNKLGLGVICVIALLVLFYPFNLWIILLLELILAANAYYLVINIHRNKNLSIILNSDDQWFLELNGDMFACELKDYWLQTGQIFIWLKGSNKSVSFILMRSIIGSQKFSQLRTQIK
ncbi:hypothetical protein MNBD_GAMMA01-173 [hydrothermal vent metagenome]|uniref:Toxin CptA n=1 Tax=hydrothermal vent metagenome TaxID=652676 RepID=A0A3B0V184_9ZZZZ